MVTRDGKRVRVVYPGIRVGNSGPDYKEAVVRFGSGAETTGDVELHLDSHDWYRHGHNTDPAYDGVVLHVVGNGDGETCSRLASGGNVPVAVFGGAMHLPGCTSLPCMLGAYGSAKRTGEVLATAGIARLRARAESLTKQCARRDPWRVLACRIARALGYTFNAGVAESVGQRLTAPDVHALLRRTDDEGRIVLVLGVAGLLPGQRRRAGQDVADDAPGWDHYWSAVEPALSHISPHEWRMNGLYPNNSPVRRMVALARLWPDMERLAGLAADVVLSESERPRQCAGKLEKLIRRSGSMYWRTHYDFGKRTPECDLLGERKAREVVVNALLPFVASRALSSGHHELLEAVVQLYAAYPAGAMHAITRHMCQQLGLPGACSTSAEQQGLLHLFTQYCRRGLCSACPLGTL